jgi:uncharacterized protein (TIGR03435 family)
MRIMVAMLSLLACAAAVHGQTAFEVASVKLTSPDVRGREQVEPSPGGLTIEKMSLRSCIAWAYQLRRDQLEGPSWVNSERVDIAAKAAGPATESDLRAMLQTLLVERFKLSFHRETKTLAVYEMTVAKGGAKLVESKAGAGADVQANKQAYEIPHTTMAAFTQRLRELGAVDLPVVDRTGLEGTYDVSLRFPSGWRPSPRPDADGVSIFTILERQLGLKLELKKNPAEVLVIDHMEQTPSAN